MAIMPMFPLGLVLLPGGVMPLHVFEPRYQKLVKDCMENAAHEFGVTLIERGFEVGGGDVRTMVGTVAGLMQVAELDGGRYGLLTVGVRRIRVNRWLPDDPYPIADVEDWPDDDADDETLEADVSPAIATTWSRVRRMNALAAELGDVHADVAAEISSDPRAASYHLCSLAPLGPADRHRLLCASGVRARLDLLGQLLDDAEAMQQFRLQHPSQGTGLDADFDEP